MILSIFKEIFTNEQIERLAKHGDGSVLIGISKVVNDFEISTNKKNPYTITLENIDKALDLVDWSGDKKYWVWQNASSLLKGLGIDAPKVGEARYAASIIREKTGLDCRRSNGKRLFLVPGPESYLTRV